LYNTRSKEYITLEELAEIVRQGIEIQVVANANGEDLTAVVLSQILLSKEKSPGGLLPITLLSALVHAGGDAFELARRFLAATTDIGHFLDEELGRRIEILISQGQITAQEGEIWLAKLQQAGKDEPLKPLSIDRLIQHSLQAQGFASRADYELLLNQVDILAAQVDLLTQRDKR